MYAQDFDMDTATWENDEVGAYVRLLNYEWINKSLPTDHRKLAKICRESFTKFEKKWKIFSEKFVTGSEGNFVNLKLESVRDEKAKFIESQREKGKKSAKARANRGSTENQPGRQPKANLSFSSSSSYNFLTEVVKKEIDKESWDAFLEIRKKKKAPLTEKAVELLCVKLETLSKNPGQTIKAIFNQTIERSYTGIFPVDGGANGKQQQRNQGAQSDGQEYPCDLEING
jgi:uncharacterized protein YdaU (DUF1376 family)